MNAPKKAGKSENQTAITKKLIVVEYKKRLKDSLKSLNENFLQILNVAKVNTDDSYHKNNVNSRMTEYNTVRAEMSARAALMVKAADELLMLTNDIREFLILRDFNFLSHSITGAEKRVKAEMDQHEKNYDNFRHTVSSLIVDLDAELLNHFSLLY